MDLLTLNSKTTNIHRVDIPYTFKLMMQECESMSISMRLITKTTPHETELVIRKPKKMELQDISVEEPEVTKKTDFDIRKSTCKFNAGDIVEITKDKDKYKTE